MSIARHHAEWLSLLEISGPFLSMPVLMDAFPQGLDADDPELARELRAAYEEWADNQGGLKPDPAIHTAWVRYVLSNPLKIEESGSLHEVLLDGQAIPDGLKAGVAEHHETLRPDLVIADPDSSKPRMLIQIHSPSQDLEKALPDKAWKASPATRMMELLHATDVRLGLVTNGEHWLLVQAKRGETTDYVSWYANLWPEERLTLRAFRTLLGIDRFFGVPEDQTLEALLDASAKDQHEVTDQLGYQVRQAVEILVQAVDRADQDRGRALLTYVDEDLLYEAALTVMMRLVFLLSAEERGLLLLGDPVYDQYYAVSTLRAQLRELADRQGEEVLERRYDAWSRLLATFRAVYGGVQHENLRLPAYGGSLFDPDRFPFLEGRLADTSWRDSRADPLPIDNRTALHLLDALQVLQVKVPGGGPAEARRLSFRALDIEQIGHVYEGLLDHMAVRAEDPVLGLFGTKNKEPEIPLPALEERQSQDETTLIDFLQDQSGRSPGALQNGMKAELDPLRAERLRAACGNDEALYQRVLPFAGLVRDDDFGWPVVIPAASVYVTAGPTRRATGTHYTPRSLTEPIVQHTLEPLVYVGPAEGSRREEWLLRSPAEILELKVCDMAMGSGAFLVQACRYLSERLVEAWENVLFERQPTTDRQSPILDPQITPEGIPATGDPAETIIPTDTEERLMLARRLVVDRCLYGVDKNHLAVEMAKLSLWLITLDKNRPFTFLDHALRNGDSLIGADEDMFLRWAHSLRNSSMPLFDQEIRNLVNESREKRRSLQAFDVRDVRDVEEKARLLAEAEAATERIRLGCDLLVGVQLLDGLAQREQEALLANALIEYIAGSTPQDTQAREALELARTLPALHWHFEFPEVFILGGFSAFVGNPPFMRGKSISTNLGKAYLRYLKRRWDHQPGAADYCAYFVLRSYQHLRQPGTLGLIATNTISQGDTRKVGLDYLVNHGATIYSALHDYPWSGSASVTVSVVHIGKSMGAIIKILDGKRVPHISSSLDTIQVAEEPLHLAKNDGKSHTGTNVLGLGFTLAREEAIDLVAKDASNVDVLFPYINGRDLNSSPTHEASRWIINFFDWPLEKAEAYVDCMSIVRERVKPQRDKVKRKTYRERWWQYAEKQKSLYEAISSLSRVLVVAQTSKHHAFVFLPPNMVFDQTLTIFALEKCRAFAQLQSTIHLSWVYYKGSSLETRPRYTPTDCYATYPFPKSTDELEVLGGKYYEHRSRIMLERQVGLTTTYNFFHDTEETEPDIVRLRELHVELDETVVNAYGWNDLDLDHGFYKTPLGIRFTISETARREVLTRLLKLNHERYEEEVRQGLHEKKRGKKRAKRRSRKKTGKSNEGQMKLF